MSNIMDPRYRGMSLGPERRRKTLSFILTEGWCKMMGSQQPCPPTDEFLSFINLSGTYATGKEWINPSLLPVSFWSMFADTPLASFANRVFSTRTTVALFLCVFRKEPSSRSSLLNFPLLLRPLKEFGHIWRKISKGENACPWIICPKKFLSVGMPI